MGLLQEKFQTVAPSAGNGSGNWVDSASARRSKPAMSQHFSDGGHSGTLLNQLPPGDNLGEQLFSDPTSPRRVMSGETDVTKDFSASAARKGYTRRNVQPTDDAYTAEHSDTFYGEAKSGELTGFVERGNVLDRI